MYISQSQVFLLKFKCQKQSFESVLEGSYSVKFCKIHRKSTAIETFFRKFADLSQQHWLRWLARLVSRFACNARMIVDASSNLPVSRVKLL